MLQVAVHHLADVIMQQLGQSSSHLGQIRGGRAKRLLGQFLRQELQKGVEVRTIRAEHLKAHRPEALCMGQRLGQERDRLLPEGVHHSLALRLVVDAGTKVWWGMAKELRVLLILLQLTVGGKVA